jgi:hypothetical protein
MPNGIDSGIDDGTEENTEKILNAILVDPKITRKRLAEEAALPAFFNARNMSYIPALKKRSRLASEQKSLFTNKFLIEDSRSFHR